MRSPVDNLKNGTFGHINYFKLCVHSKSLGEKHGKKKKKYTYKQSYIVPGDKKKKKKRHKILGG